MLDDYFDAYASAYKLYKGGDWCYEDGCVYRGLLMLDGVDPAGPWFGHLERLISQQVAPDGALAGYDPEEFNIDNILSGRLLFPLYERTGDERYRKAAEKLIRQLLRHPRIATGNYWHKLRYPHQVWLDGLYMGLPFQIEYGQRTGSEGLVTDALDQLAAALDILRDPDTGLYCHGYDHARKQEWADTDTGLSPAFWSRAIGWMAMALVDTVSLVGTDAGRQYGLTSAASELAVALEKYIRPDGRWNQVTDQPGLAGNYPETSATAMLAYFYLVGERLGMSGIDGKIGERALSALETHSLRNENGYLALHDICAVAGLGGFSGHYRDGTAAYYLSEPIVADDAKGVGPTMMAVAEFRRRAARLQPEAITA